jgi:hypothetical protein
MPGELVAAVLERALQAELTTYLEYDRHVANPGERGAQDSVLFAAHRSAPSRVFAGQYTVSSRILTMETLCRLS